MLCLFTEHRKRGTPYAREHTYNTAIWATCVSRSSHPFIPGLPCINLQVGHDRRMFWVCLSFTISVYILYSRAHPIVIPRTIMAAPIPHSPNANAYNNGHDTTLPPSALFMNASLNQPSFHEPKKQTPASRPGIVEELYGTPRKPKSFQQWEDTAKETTRQIKECGSPSPLVWVYTSLVISRSSLG